MQKLQSGNNNENENNFLINLSLCNILYCRNKISPRKFFNEIVKIKIKLADQI